MSVSWREDREWRGGVEELGQGRHGRKLDRQVNLAPSPFLTSVKSKTYKSVPHDTSNGRRHVNTIPDNVVRRQNHNIVVHPGPLLPQLLPNHPDIRRLVRERGLRLRSSLQRIVRDHELQSLHGLQPALERFTRLDEMAKGFIVAGLDGQGGVVRGRVKEG